MKILVIEDRANIVQLIRLYLEQAGYTVISTSDGIAGLELHAREQPDLVILDLMLPILDGMEVGRRIRAWADTPILMLTAHQGEEDRIEGLELGADDYLMKPFRPRELVSRVKAILRRSKGQSASQAHEPAEKETSSENEELRFGGLLITIPSRRVSVRGQSIALAVKEFDLLVTLRASSHGTIPLRCYSLSPIRMVTRCGAATRNLPILVTVITRRYKKRLARPRTSQRR